MEDHEIRLECMKLVLKINPHINTVEELAVKAQKLWHFAVGIPVEAK